MTEIEKLIRKAGLERSLRARDVEAAEWLFANCVANSGARELVRAQRRGERIVPVGTCLDPVIPSGSPIWFDRTEPPRDFDITQLELVPEIEGDIRDHQFLTNLTREGLRRLLDPASDAPESSGVFRRSVKFVRHFGGYWWLISNQGLGPINRDAVRMAGRLVAIEFN